MKKKISDFFLSLGINKFDREILLVICLFLEIELSLLGR